VGSRYSLKPGTAANAVQGIALCADDLAGSGRVGLCCFWLPPSRCAGVPQSILSRELLLSGTGVFGAPGWAAALESRAVFFQGGKLGRKPLARGHKGSLRSGGEEKAGSMDVVNSRECLARVVGALWSGCLPMGAEGSESTEPSCRSLLPALMCSQGPLAGTTPTAPAGGGSNTTARLPAAATPDHSLAFIRTTFS